MTIRIEVQCDGSSCSRATELEDYTDRDIEDAGWFVDHKYGGHYCADCTAEVKKELAEEEAV